MRTYAIGFLALVSLVISSGCCCCEGMQHGCGYRPHRMHRHGCNPCCDPCANPCANPCGQGGLGYPAGVGPTGPAIIAPQQGTMIAPTTSSAYIPSATQTAAVPLESLPTY